MVSLADPEFLKGLIRVSEVYKNMAVELSKIAVPKDLTQTHMEILNGYMASSDGLTEMNFLLTDPVMAMVGMQRHVEAEEDEKNC